MTEKAKKYLTDIGYAIEKFELYTQGIVAHHLAPLKLEVQNALTM